MTAELVFSKDFRSVPNPVPGATKAFGGAAAAVAAAASLMLGEFRAGQLSLFLTLAVLAVRLDLVWGYSGILSLGQLLPFGIAAYTTARFATAAPSLSLPGLLPAAAAFS